MNVFAQPSMAQKRKREEGGSTFAVYIPLKGLLEGYGKQLPPHRNKTIE
jgi:hypothetical protein